MSVQNEDPETAALTLLARTVRENTLLAAIDVCRMQASFGGSAENCIVSLQRLRELMSGPPPEPIAPSPTHAAPSSRQ